MKKLATITTVGLGLFVYCFALVAPAAYAATATSPTTTSTSTSKTPGTGEALEIGPPVVTLSGNPGQVLNVELSLRDISSGDLLVKGQVNDFTASGEDGTPKILVNNDPGYPYSIISWVKALPSFTLKPKQIYKLPITITIPATASPGGHYGVIRFTATPPSLNGTGVALSASLGSLVLIRVNGQAKENMSISQFATSKNGKTGSLFQSAPVDFVVKLTNNGNLQELPTGHIAVTNMFGKLTAGVNVNVPPRYVLPGSTRKFTSTLGSTTIGNKKLFGRYTAALTVTYGTPAQTITSKLSFWVIPYRLIGFIVVAIIVGFFLLRFLIKRYNRRIISKAQGPKSAGTPPAKKSKKK